MGKRRKKNMGEERRLKSWQSRGEEERGNERLEWARGAQEEGRGKMERRGNPKREEGEGKEGRSLTRGPGCVWGGGGL